MRGPSVTPPRCTVILVTGGLMPYGTTALIWVGEAYHMGAGTPSKNTCVPPSVVGYGAPAAGWASAGGLGPSAKPKMLTTSPGATVPSGKKEKLPGWKLAAFSTQAT